MGGGWASIMGYGTAWGTACQVSTCVSWTKKQGQKTIRTLRTLMESICMLLHGRRRHRSPWTPCSVRRIGSRRGLWDEALRGWRQMSCFEDIVQYGKLTGHAI